MTRERLRVGRVHARERLRRLPVLPEALYHRRTMERYDAKVTSVPPLSTALLGLVAVLAGAVLGGLYGVLQARVFEVVAKVGGVLIVPVVLGVCISMCARFLRVRNASVIVSMCLVGALVYRYCSWVSYLFALGGFDAFRFRPAFVFRGLQAVLDHGAWGITEDKLARGTFLLVLWCLETLLLFALAAAGSLIGTGRPYCERCNTWVNQKKMYGPFGPLKNDAGTRHDLELGLFDSLRSLKPGKADAEVVTVICLESCPRCNESNYLTVEKRTKGTDFAGNKVNQTRAIVERMKVSTGEYNDLIGFLGS